jgi:hypothetical protein
MIAFTFVDTKSCSGGRHPKPIGYEDVVGSLTESVTLNKVLARKCVGALVNFENGPFRVRMDGGNPVDSATLGTASGYLRSSGDEYFCSREEAQTFVAILSPVNGAVDGALRVTYYG